MRDYAYYNGVMTPYDACTIPLYDRAIFFAEAVYDVMIGRGGIAYQLDEHLERLTTNAEAIGLTNIPSKEEIEIGISDVLHEAGDGEFMLYVQLSGKGERRGHSRTESGANLLITVTEARIPSELTFTDAITLPDLRYGYCHLKTTNLLPAVFSIAEAERYGCDIAIFKRGDVITEASHANVSLLKDGVLSTHPLDSDILHGISERNLIEAAREIGIAHRREVFTYRDIFEADAVLLTSTTKLVRVCRSVDKRATECRALDEITEIFRLMMHDFMVKTT